MAPVYHSLIRPHLYLGLTVPQIAGLLFAGVVVLSLTELFLVVLAITGPGYGACRWLNEGDWQKGRIWWTKCVRCPHGLNVGGSRYVPW